MEQNEKFVTFMGTPIDYDHLRAWIKAPYTLTDRETQGYREFIESHGIEIDKSDFGWFFEVYYRHDCQLSQNEINGLLKIVDEMEQSKQRT